MRAVVGGWAPWGGRGEALKHGAKGSCVSVLVCTVLVPPQIGRQAGIYLSLHFALTDKAGGRGGHTHTQHPPPTQRAGALQGTRLPTHHTHTLVRFLRPCLLLAAAAASLSSSYLTLSPSGNNNNGSLVVFSPLCPCPPIRPTPPPLLSPFLSNCSSLPLSFPYRNAALTSTDSSIREPQPGTCVG